MDIRTTSTRFRTIFATAILCAFSAGFGISARADGINERSITVKYGDLNLSNPQGANTLYSRIVGAAHEVCDLPFEGLSFRAEAQACREKAIADAVMKVGHPELTAVYNAKNRDPLPVIVARR
jgi:UrcA family protein